MIRKFWQWLVGAPFNPMSNASRRKVLLIAFFAWIGLGSDGLSSANYGPEEAFRALGAYPMLGLYLAVAIALTVFIISASYNQVIELFPNGGGGYKVANQLVHPIAGLISGSALIIDYILTIAISVAAASDAMFSLLPASYLEYNLFVKILLVVILTVLNLRGMKESIKILLPIFLGFVFTHMALIIYGIAAHDRQIPLIVSDTINQTHTLSKTIGWGATIAILLRAYSLGGGTYTGLEAVSNNVNVLAEPRVSTGKWTMFYMALSLSVTAGGITFLYMLWNVGNVPGETYNAVLMGKLFSRFAWGHLATIILLAFEAGILFLGANTGFLGGPAVLANMAVDRWAPNQFINLSSRLVKQNGVIVFGLGAIAIMLLTQGFVSFLVILYSTNVFLTFAITIFGLCKYWWKQRLKARNWHWRLGLSIIGFLVCSGILVTILIEKFSTGGWLTVIVTTSLIIGCYYIHRYYLRVDALLKKVDDVLIPKKLAKPEKIARMNTHEPVAVVFVNKNKGLGLHTILWIQRLFPDQYKNFVFAQVGVVDVKNFGGEEKLEHMQEKVEENLQFFVDYMHSLGFAAKSYSVYGTSAIQKLPELAELISMDFPHCIFFAGKIVFDNDSIFTRMLHNETATAVQDRLHCEGKQMVIMPMKLSWK